MSVKSKLRSILGDLVHKPTIGGDKTRTSAKQAIKNIIINPEDLPGQLQEKPQGFLIRILASDDTNANRIACQIESNKQELSVISTHIADQALEYTTSRSKEPIYTRSVIVKIEPKSLLKSATYILNTGYREYLQREVLERDGNEKNDNIVIDFSSPNIAKPFHYGHLKSTILGNYLANINRFLGNKVTKLNYIGDWGTQYGLLSLGLDEFGDRVISSSPGRSPLRELLDIYIKANEKGRADESFYGEAKRRFLLMDTESDSDQMQKWRQIKDTTLEELKRSYQRLGVNFDEFEFESQYAKDAKPIVKKMLDRKFARRLEDGVTVAQIEKNDKILEIPVMRSDGASLYITRDVAAAISRKERFGFDKMLYVVGADQERHFHCVSQIIKGLGYDWYKQLMHVKMGKVLGMSSRSGNFVLLSDIIDEATRMYILQTKNTLTSKVTNDDETEIVGRHLAISALFVYDMQNARTRHYEFDWSQLMVKTNRSGINLQTTFARLASLSKRAAHRNLKPIESADNLDLNALSCAEAANLMSYLDELDTSLHSSYWSMDPSPLINHAHNLCKAINRARRSEKLLVLNESNEDFARTRLSLFESARLQLELIIKMIGLKPLDRV